MNVKQKENIGWNMLSSFTDSCEKLWSYNKLVLFHSAAVCIRMAFLKGKFKKKKGHHTCENGAIAKFGT